MPSDIPALLDDSLGSARACLAAAIETLHRAGLWLDGAADDTRWESPAGRAFHARVDDLRSRALSLQGRARQVERSVDHARAVLAEPW